MVKILFYLPDLNALNGKLYPFFQLQTYFKTNSQNHQLDIFLNGQSQELSDGQLSEYDVLFVGCNKFKNTSFPRYHSYFLKHGKKVFNIKSTTALEFMTADKPLIYGIPSDYFLLQPGSAETPYFIQDHSKVVSFPVFPTLKYKKNDGLSVDEFYDYYHLDKSLKLVVMLPGRLDKLINFHTRKNKSPNHLKLVDRLNWFFKNVNQIREIFKNIGYQVVVKNHCNSKKYLKNLPSNIWDKDWIFIEDQHTYEIINYAERAITIGSSIVYETYLYDLPTLEFGTGCYLFSWSRGYFNKQSQDLLRDDPNCQKLIFGHLVQDEELKNLDKLIQNFVNINYLIENFNYRIDNPLHGNTYCYDTVEKIYKRMLELCELSS